MKQKLPKDKKDRSNLPIHSSKKALILSLKKQYLVGILAIITLVTASVVSLERNQKKIEAIAKILREHFTPVCEQYALVTLQSGEYPCFECESGKISLKRDEVWRYGFAGEGGESKRYPSKIYYQDGTWKLTKQELYYETQLRGYRWRCLIEEVIKIIDYPDLPEARAREIKLIRPPGNKQDR